MSFETVTDDSTEEIADGIAIIGMSGRFPSAPDLSAFWENIKNGVNCIVPISDEEIELSQEDRAIAENNPNYVKKAASVADSDRFDAKFFGIYPKEAEVMDPQHRLFLECSWHAIEDAGYDPDQYDGAIGVYAGCYMNTYLLSSIESNPAFMASIAKSFHGGSLNTELGNDKDYLATRVSFKLNLRGPSITLQTACSTSLVAIAQACQSLMSYQCDMALAGASTLKFPQNRGYLYVDGGMVSPDGLCKTFDARANGTIFGNGVGVVLLKRLEDALADGDSIYAVVRGWGLNNDGASKVGYTAPSVDGQMEAIALAQAVADIDPATIGYIEAHGTGTPLGDPIEIDALTKAFRLQTDAKQFCAIGSLKTNIGHLDCAAGVAGVIKTALSMQHKMLPPTLNFESPNPNIDFENSPFFVNTKLQSWESQTPRRAGVSSFGVGGTNAHIVMEEGPEKQGSQPTRDHHLLMFSARSEEALNTMSDNLLHYLRNNPDVELADVAHTLQVGRRTFNYSRVLVAKTPQDAVDQLESLNSQQVFTKRQLRRDLPTVFMFPGQGSQHINMGRDLYEAEPLYRQEIDHCAELLRPHMDVDLRTMLYPDMDQLDDTQLDEIRTRINQTAIAQPAIFATSYALAKLWMARGIEPVSMIGHSVGEFVAATLAGIFSLKDALELVALRGKMMQDLPPGSMMAARLSEELLQPYLAYNDTLDVEIGAINGPSMCILSGPTAQIESIQSRLEADGIVCRPLHTSHAFHSAMMEAAIEPFAAKVRTLALNPPQKPIVSTVSTTWLTDGQATDPMYWARHLREPVRFSDSVALLVENANQILLEVGPGQVLGTLARQHPDKSSEQVILSSLPHVQQEISDVDFSLQTLGRLWQSGVNLSWDEFYANERRLRLHLPLYPFERKRFWYDTFTDGTSNSAKKEESTAAGLQGASTAPNSTIDSSVMANGFQSAQAAVNGLSASEFPANGISTDEINAGDASSTYIVSEAPVAEVSTAGISAAQRLIEQQMQLMEMQLAALQQARNGSR